MKKVLLFAGMIASQFVNAQDNETYVHRYVGLGIRASIFQISELPISVIPPNRLLINIDPIKYARAEFHFGTYSHSYELSAPSSTLKMTETSSLFGFGVFGMYPVGSVKFIAGARYSINNYSQTDLAFDTFGNAYTVEDKGKIGIIAPVIGGEYFFSKWFSIGAEFSYLMTTDEFNPADPNAENETTTTNITESSLLFRFYPR
jgi:hypothetical protein